MGWLSFGKHDRGQETKYESVPTTTTAFLPPPAPPPSASPYTEQQAETAKQDEVFAAAVKSKQPFAAFLVGVVT
jgi:hypothetical protein